jgi:predicted RNA methylase
VRSINLKQWRVAIQMAEKASGSLRGKSVAVLDPSFKPNTDDMREVASITLVKALIRKGAKVCARDVNVQGVLISLAARIQKPGPSLTYLIYYACDLFWRRSERKMGIETYGNLPHELVQQFCDDATAYEPTSFIDLPEILSYINPDDVFIDVGCGKGRVIWFVGSRLKLKKIIGVEIVPELVVQAKRNLVKYQRAMKCPIDIIEADATRVDLSQGNVFYLYNPFGEKTVAKLLANIRRSLLKKRRIRIIYMNPSHGYLLDRTSWLHPTVTHTVANLRVWDSG